MRRRLFNPAGVLVALALALPGCDLFDGEDDEPVVPSSVVIVNGGNFGDQNGSLTLYDPETGATTSVADLGAFAQGATVRDGMAYVSLNTFTAGRIDVVDLSGGAVVQQIGVPAPRATAFVNAGTLLATNLSTFGAEGPEPGIVSKITVETGAVEEMATVGLYPEGLVVAGGAAFVANSGNLGDGTTLSVIDLSSNAVGEIELGCDGPNEVFVDGDGEIVVVCAGKTVYNEDFTEIIEETNGQVLFLSPSNRNIVDRIELNLKPGSASGAQTAFFAAGSDELYVLSDPTDEILRFETSTNSLLDKIDVPDASGLTGLAAVAYDAGSERIYIARLAEGAGGFPDFTAAGAVLVLNRSGSQLDRFAAGPSPTHIALVE